MKKIALLAVIGTGVMLLSYLYLLFDFCVGMEDDDIFGVITYSCFALGYTLIFTFFLLFYLKQK